MEDALGIVFVFLVLLPLGLGFAGLYRVITPYARGRRGAGRELLGCVGWFLLFGLIVALLLPATGGSRTVARRTQCTNNLKMIVLAMRDYHEHYGCFPPAYTVDKAGKPLHSWRVLLLPFMCWQSLYDEIRLDEPYDSPHNREVFAIHGPVDPMNFRMPFEFRCPEDGENRTDTNYVMLLGTRTLSNGSNSVRLKDITDGPSNTIAVVETYGLGIRWYEPRDLRVDEMSFKINDPEYFSISSRHAGGANVGFADGSARFLSDHVDPRAVEAMTTINGGEQ